MAAQTVLITGATGFIGSHVALATLQTGRRVRFTIRRLEQKQALAKLFAPHLQQIEFVLVPDMTKPEAFAEVLRDVGHVFHLASPMPGSSGSDIKRDYVEPAVRGTLAILGAAKAHGNIKRVILMSSVLALESIQTLKQRNTIIRANTDKQIPVDLDMDFEKDYSGNFTKYHISKILAHQAYRDWLQENDPSFAVVTFHPTYVLGPDLWQTSLSEISGINALLWQSLHSLKPTFQTSWVDVRDVADAHIRVLDATISSGTEITLAGPTFKWQDAVNHIKAKYPMFPLELQGPFEGSFQVDASLAETNLGMVWTAWDKIMDSVLEQQLSFAK